MIAALFVATDGVYFGLPDVDPWDAKRDARLYSGPHAIVAHPPCERWGRYWSGGPSAKVKRKLGEDGGCFYKALESVVRFGDPEGSHAFSRYGLRRPEWRKGWQSAGDKAQGGFVCCVAQGNYGHRARKLTWLYAYGTALPELDWSIPEPRSRLDYGFHSNAERAERAHIVAPRVNASRLTAAENLQTPISFRDVLLGIARSVNK